MAQRNRCAKDRRYNCYQCAYVAVRCLQIAVSTNVLDDCVAALFNGEDADIDADVFSAAEAEVRHCVHTYCEHLTQWMSIVGPRLPGF